MQSHELALVRGKARLESLVHVTQDVVDRDQPWRLDHALVLRPSRRSSELWMAWCALA